MKNQDLYGAIFKRKSIRNYDLTPLEKSKLTEISDHLNDLKPIFDDIKTELKIISSDDVNRRFMRKSPHYLVVFSENKEGYLTNVGYMLQQMDLFLSANGIGSCWQGIPKPKKDVLDGSNLEFIILIAFGMANEPLYRENISEFKRKSLKEISNISGNEDLLDAARLAPFGSGQPWFFSGDEKMIHAYSVKPGFIMSFLAKKYIPLDVGIAFCHLKIAAEHFGKNTDILLDKKAPDYSSKGYKYIISLKLS